MLGGICNVMQCHDNLIDDSGRLVFMMTVIEMLILMMSLKRLFKFACCSLGLSSEMEDVALQLMITIRE